MVKASLTVEPEPPKSGRSPLSSVTTVRSVLQTAAVPLLLPFKNNLGCNQPKILFLTFIIYRPDGFNHEIMMREVNYEKSIINYMNDGVQALAESSAIKLYY